MAFTRRQPIRRNTVARTGFTALDVEPAASGSGAQIFAPRDRQPGALLLCHGEPSILGFPIKIIKPVVIISSMPFPSGSTIRRCNREPLIRR